MSITQVISYAHTPFFIIIFLPRASDMILHDVNIVNKTNFFRYRKPTPPPIPDFCYCEVSSVLSKPFSYFYIFC